MPWQCTKLQENTENTNRLNCIVEKLKMAEIINKDAKWIWLTDDRFKVSHWVEFRKTVNIDNPENAMFIIAADTAYQLWINQQLVDDACFSELPEVRYYNRIDVSAYLCPGRNCIAVLGYYQGVNTSRYVAGRPMVLFELKCSGKSILKSDSTCKARTSQGYLSGDVPLVTRQLGLTIQYDASKDDDWKSVGYDHSHWEYAQEIAPAYGLSGCNLTAYPIKRFEISYKTTELIMTGLLKNVPQNGTFADLVSGADLYEAANLTGLNDIVLPATEEGSFAIFDLKLEECGYLAIEIEAVDKTVIDIAHGEHLVDGRVRAKIHSRNFADRYITRRGYQCWSMPVRKLGCRYLELHVRNGTNPVKINSVCLKTVEYPTRIIERFECSDKLVEDIVETSRRTAKLCMLENYVDTPWREQAFYSLDAANQALCGYYLFGEYDYPEKCLRLLGKSRFCETYLAVCAPSDLKFTIPCFTMAWINAVRDFTLFSGRTRLAEDYLQYIEKFIVTQINALDKGVLKNETSADYWNFYEWSQGLDGTQMTNGKPGFGEDPEEYHSCKTLFFLEAIKSYNDICSYLGKNSIITDQIVSTITQGINDKFYCGEIGLFANRFPLGDGDVFSELTQSLACNYITLSSDQIKSMRRHFISADKWVTTTLSMKKYQFAALEKIIDDDGKSVLDTIRREWGYMLSLGATSFWETLKGESDFDGAGSLCHGWSIVPTYYIYAGIIGIKPLEPGFKKFSFSPKFAKLDFVKGCVPTPAGDIKVQWHRKGEKIEMEIEYPLELEMIDHIEDRQNITLKISSF
jgi:alpha-L-rhamnosidase